MGNGVPMEEWDVERQLKGGGTGLNQIFVYSNLNTLPFFHVIFRGKVVVF